MKIIVLIVLFFFHHVSSFELSLFDEYIKKKSSIVKIVDVHNNIAYFKEGSRHEKVQNLMEEPHYYDTLAIHEDMNYSDSYYFQCGTFHLFTENPNYQKVCLKQVIREALHYGAIAVIGFNIEKHHAINSTLCTASFLHAL